MYNTNNTIEELEQQIEALKENRTQQQHDLIKTKLNELISLRSRLDRCIQATNTIIDGIEVDNPNDTIEGITALGAILGGVKRKYSEIFDEK